MTNNPTELVEKLTERASEKDWPKSTYKPGDIELFTRAVGQITALTAEVERLTVENHRMATDGVQSYFRPTLERAEKAEAEATALREALRKLWNTVDNYAPDLPGMDEAYALLTKLDGGVE